MRPDIPVVTRRGIRLVGLPAALVSSYPLLDERDWRAAACEAVRDGRASAAELQEAQFAASRVPGRARIAATIQLISTGCESPIELDYLELVEVPFGLPPGERQAVLPGRRRGDVFYRSALLLVELDGKEDHSSDLARRADIRRDASLAALGIRTLRFTGRQVREEPEWVAGVVRAALDRPAYGAP